MENIKIFNGLDKNSISKIEKFMQKRVYIAGEKIFQEGELGEELYILSNGLVGIYKAGVKLGELGEKEVFGEMAIIDNQSRSATVTAETNVEVFVLSHEDFDRLKRDDIEAYATITVNIAKDISIRLREINDKVQRIWKWYISAN